MRVVVQRVREADVTVDGVTVGRIGRGLVLLVGLATDDGPDDLDWMVRKIAGLRVFDDATGPLKHSVVEAGGGVLAVSQFTLLADTRKGRRPSFDGAMRAVEAAPLFDVFVARLADEVGSVATGRFGTTMEVRLVNDGPFTLVVDSPRASDASLSKV
jgi:D-tyrosyl-tRNA(Tyr) deacylase